MGDSIILASGQTLDAILATLNSQLIALQAQGDADHTAIAALQTAIAKIQTQEAQDKAAIAVAQTAVTALQTAVAALQMPTTSATSGTSGTSGTTPAGGSGGGSSGTSGTTTPTTNAEGMTLSIAPGTFTFSNITPGIYNNTIAIVGVQNCKMPFPALSIIRSNIALNIDYAGYVHALVPPGTGPITYTAQAVDSVGGSTATASFSVPVVQVPAQQQTRSPGAYSGLPTTGLVSTPKFASTATAIGFNIINAAINAPTTFLRYVRFVQAFPKGFIAKGDVPTLASMQCDPINTWSDGSLKTALITVNQTSLGSGATAQYAITSGTAPVTSPTPIDLANALAHYSLEFAIQFLNNDGTNNGTITKLDLVAEMLAALKSGAASVFQSGPLVTQSRVVVPVSGSLYLNVDISAFADGSIWSDVAVRNDIAMGATGGSIYTSGTITQNGTAVYQWKQLYQTQYQSWWVDFGTSPRCPLTVQLDPANLITAAAIQPYNLALGVDASTITGYEAATAQAGWLQPLNPNNVDIGMPGTGGRPDIGYLPQYGAVAAITCDPRAIDYCLAQADVSGSAPWNYWDAANGVWLNTENYPGIWTDQGNRGGVGTPGDKTSGGPTQLVLTTPQGWALDNSHQPDLAFIPWLYTGRRVYLDQVLAQGAWSVASTYARSQTAPGASVVTPQSLWGGQVRAIAWNMRQVSNGGYCAPSNTPYGAYFASILAQNATYCAAMQAALQTAQGSIYGYLEQDHGTGNFAPWEQNYLVPILALEAARDNATWTPLVSWFARFTVESFTAQNDGPYKGAVWNQRNGANYELFTGDPGNSSSGTGTPLFTAQTFAQIEYLTARGGQSNGGETYDATTDTVTAGTPNWSNSAGDYAQLCGATLAWAVRLKMAGADAALTWLQASGAPYVDAGSLQQDPTFSLVG